MVCRVGDKNVSTAVYCYSLREFKLCFGGAFAPPFRDESAGRIELLDAVVRGIGDINGAGAIHAEGIYGDAAGKVERSVSRARASPFRDEPAGRIELLDAIVFRIGDKDVARDVRGDARGFSELPLACAFGSPLCYEGAVGIELLDAVVARVGDKDEVGVIVSSRAQGDAAGKVELPFPCACASPLCDEGAVGVELLYAVIYRVEDVDISLAVECSIPRFNELPGCIACASPGNTEVDFWSRGGINQRFHVYPDAAPVRIRCVAHLHERG